MAIETAVLGAGSACRHELFPKSLPCPMNPDSGISRGNSSSGS
jgi:hypothetical protein